MRRKTVYWGSTGVASLMLLTSLSYLTGSEQVVSGFTDSGYPQHLRIVLGIAKPAAAIVLLMPGLGVLKEWAYAGATFAWVMAAISAYLSQDGSRIWLLPIALVAILGVSYFSRPPSRRCGGSTGD